MAAAEQCWRELRPHPVAGADCGWWMVGEVAIDSGAATKPTGEQQATTCTYCDEKDPENVTECWTSSESMHFVGLCVHVSVPMWVLQSLHLGHIHVCLGPVCTCACVCAHVCVS